MGWKTVNEPRFHVLVLRLSASTQRDVQYYDVSCPGFLLQMIYLRKLFLLTAVSTIYRATIQTYAYFI